MPWARTLHQLFPRSLRLFPIGFESPSAHRLLIYPLLQTNFCPLIVSIVKLFVKPFKKCHFPNPGDFFGQISAFVFPIVWELSILKRAILVS
jgi:hypothetical protein